jgi:hypothetical protein
MMELVIKFADLAGCNLHFRVGSKADHKLGNICVGLTFGFGK